MKVLASCSSIWVNPFKNGLSPETEHTFLSTLHAFDIGGRSVVISVM
ncbi:hypothetical protein B0G38_003584 [Arthrobacter sp. VKM Ac-2550]|nr:hypothetical protein [Arthrobacter sp. VKM Ac-2550]